MNKKLTALVTILLCMYLDSIVFARINLLDIRPDAMLAATVSFAILTGSFSGAVFGAAGGLLMDTLFGRSFGLYGMVYMTAGLISGYFYKKFYADNLIVPAAAASAAGLFKDILLAFIVFAGGARFDFVRILVGYILPSAMMTGALGMLMQMILKPQLQRQVKRRQADHLSR